ncbi:MAG TPA: hypothetical protein VHM20_01295, partial [Gammaproteobacteria bacterium]|nr:hypothetical protein [Gammaproteobacteria bacterium]
AKQFQYAEALQNGTRGHYVYNPVGPDSFIVDIFGGQVIKNNDGSFLPFIGKIPKNFDKEFKQSTELCASFVIRMLHSSRLLSHCPTFLKNYLKMKADFLPNVETIPALPSILEESIFLKEKMQALKESLSQKPEERDFDQSEKLLLSLFKNIVYQLRTLRTKDANFSVFHYHLVNTSQFVKTASRANLEKVIRMLKINAPVKNDMDNKDFLLKVTYLENLIQAFYPVPSVETARRIQKMAAIYKKPFTIHKDIQDYFKILQNSQANLSRRQSPGMLFTKLRGDMVKHKRTLAEKRQDFDRMHQKNFLAGYRDPEGSMVVQPTKSDQFLDFAAKGVAKFAVGVQHDSNPLGHIITAPFISAYNGGKNNYATDAGLANFYKVPLGLTGGLLHGVNDSGFKAIAYSTKFIARPGIRAKDAIEYYHSKIDTRTTTGKLAMAGVFIPAVFGIVSGMLESIFKLIYDCTLYPVQDLVKFSMAKVYDEKEFASIKDHPLYIPALPDNEPGFKVKMSDQTRDILLASTTQEMLLKKLRKLIRTITKTAHPDFTREERKAIASQLLNESILTEKEWEEF